MVSCLYTCPAAALAKSLLDVWLSGDHARLRRELDHVSRVTRVADNEDEDDRVELLRSIAVRMKESPDLFAARAENPRIGIWFDLLHHLSAESSLIN
jgi:hypothetical protein